MFKFNPLVMGTILLALIVGLHTYQLHANPCYDMLRLHVIANSDTPVDQAVKLQVRDEVIKIMQQKFAGVKNDQQAVEMAGASLDEITQAADDVLRKSGKDYAASAYLGQYDFPTRIYGARVFPSGEYTAVRVVLGRGEGRNWWCVLFPPLCLRDIKQATGMSGPVNIRFKSLDMLRRGKNMYLHRTAEIIN